MLKVSSARSYSPFRDPKAQGCSALAVLGTLQPWAFGSLKSVETIGQARPLTDLEYSNRCHDIL